jgi:hypothetical protein
MLSHEQNLRICLTGPGTPMGDALRRYWIPMCPAKDVERPDGPPRPVMRLGAVQGADQGSCLSGPRGR